MQGESKMFNPVDLDLSRSTFSMHPTNTCTFNAGRLIPQKVLFIQPGDSIKMNVRNLVKMSTPVYPTMDALFEDVYFFFVPMRGILSRRYGSPSVDDARYSWAAFIGAQDNLLNMPLPSDGVSLPTLLLSSDNRAHWKPGSLIDYFDVDYRDSSQSKKFSALPLMAYFAIWNENFRDPNVMTPITWQFNNDGTLIPYGDVEILATKDELSSSRPNAGTASSDYKWVNALGGNLSSGDTASLFADKWLPLPVCRFHGYFGSLLPWPQRNAEGVELPLGDTAPVVGNGNTILDVHDMGTVLFGYKPVGLDPIPVDGAVLGTGSSETAGILYYRGLSSSNTAGNKIGYSNLVVDLTSATAANVNALRAAIQKQRWYEKLARSGNRYDELEYGLFGVRPHDSGDDRPLYLGGKRIPLNIEMVASTNGGTSTSAGVGGGSLGSLGAYSHTNDEDDYFYHSFDDWGILFCVSCVRHHDTFSSGTDRFWHKLIRDDLYFPTFAHLGEQGTFEWELTASPCSDTTLLGYNPAWEEYRTQLDRVHGLIRPSLNLGFMTYSREYDADTTLAQFLNASTMVETIDKTLAVTSNAAGFQFISQKTFDFSWRRCMPTDSIPGLMDHF